MNTFNALDVVCTYIMYDGLNYLLYSMFKISTINESWPCVTEISYFMMCVYIAEISFEVKETRCRYSKVTALQFGSIHLPLENHVFACGCIKFEIR